jgi:anti-sigma B factor antagonist
MDLVLTDRMVGEWTVVGVKGEVDLSSAGQLRDHLSRLVNSGRTQLVADLTEVSFMDSSGLGALVSVLKGAKEKDGDLALICPEGSVLKIFAITGLDNVFRVFADEGVLADA